MVTRSIQYVYRESGLASVYATGLDAWLIILARSCRMFAYGASSLILALFFAELHVSDERIGLFMSLTLAGDVFLSLVLTFLADHFGRRRTILVGSLLMIASGLVFALFENYWLLLLAAIVGVISATGGDFGPFRVVEESMLSELTDPTTRSDVLAWYVTTSVLGSSLGFEVAGRVIQTLHAGPLGWSLLRTYHICYLAYAATGILNLLLSLLLSKRCELHGRLEAGSRGQVIALTETHATVPEVPETPETSETPGLSHDGESSDSSSYLDAPSVDSYKRPRTRPLAQQAADNEEEDDLDDATTDDGSAAEAPTSWRDRFSQISAPTRRTMYGLWFLLMVDSLADGMASMALTTYYMDVKFHLSKDVLGNILSASYFLAACSSVFAGPLSRYIGLVNTMVFTHVPSSAAVLLFPLPSSVWLTCVLLLLRVGLNNLDQAPRAALIAAVVHPEERTAVMGVTSLLRTLASTTGPSLTGLLAGQDRFWVAFVVAGALRLAYDFGLFAMFVNIRLYQYEAVPTAAGDAGPETVTRSTSEVLGHPDSFALDEEESVEGQ